MIQIPGTILLIVATGVTPTFMCAKITSLYKYNYIFQNRMKIRGSQNLVDIKTLLMDG